MAASVFRGISAIKPPALMNLTAGSAKDNPLRVTWAAPTTATSP